ncbi:MAG: Ig-like domain-containing protein [Pseudomonadota bacterium]
MPDGIFEIGSTEAESLDLAGAYEVETRGDASGGEVIQVPSAVGQTGIASGTFSGPAGNYSIAVDYFNENDGEATWQVLVNGVVIGQFTGNGGTGPTGSLETETFTADLEDGDTVAISVVADAGERGRVDRVVITDNSAALISVGETEAEDMVIGGGYEIQNRNNVSGGQVVGTTTSGTVSGEFTGTTGAYNIDVTYLDENDGVGTYELLVNGQVIESWLGDGPGSGLGTPTVETVTAVLNQGDIVTIRGTAGDGEAARLDKINIEAATAFDVGTVEAEDLILDGYTVESNENASGDAVIRTEGTGTASGFFAGQDGTYNLTINYLDENDGLSTYSVFVNGEEVAFFTADEGGSTGGTPDSETIQIDLNGGDLITIQGTRQAAEFARIDSVNMVVINTSPTTVADTATTDEDTSVNVDVLANDSDAENDTLTIVAIAGTDVVAGDTVDLGDATATLEANGTITVTPDADFSGDVTFAYSVSDGARTSDGTATVTVEPVNDAPVASNDVGSTEEDTSVNINVLDNDTDPENDALSVVAIAGTAVVAGDSVDVGDAMVTLEANGTLTVTPDENFDGNIVFGYSVSDGEATSDATVAVSVGAVNDGLLAVDDSATTDEDSATNLDVLSNDIDPDSDPLTVTAIAGTAVSAGDTVDVGNAAVTLEANGTLTVTPDPDFSGDLSFVYTVSDGEVVDDGLVSVTVNPVNDNPVATDDAVTTAEDTAASLNVLANDTDADGDTLTVTAIAGTSVSAGDSVDIGNATVTLEGNGTLTITPDADFSGAESFTYAVSDGTTSDVGSVAVTVSDVNDSPVATDDTAETDEDTPVRIDVVANDTDPENANLTVTAVAGTAIATGGSVNVGDATVTLGSDGALTVTPNGGFRGNVSFDYTVSDGGQTDTGSVSLAVNGVISDPTDGDDTIEGTPGDNNFNGGDGDDQLFGLAGDDTLFGDAGDDIVAGGGGDDLLNGGDGDDDVRGGSGVDTLLGGDGNDRLRVGGGYDFGFGGDGDDFLPGAAGDDTMFGEDGNDVLYGGTGMDELSGGDGDDELRAGAQDDILDGGAGNDTLLSQSGDDIADGGDGDDLVNGAAGNDTLLGGAGNDRLNGGSGNDTLQGGAGDDDLRGQAGLDTFVFDADEGGSDTVVGYEEGETIRLVDFGYATAEEAAADFSQSGNNVVFQNGDSTVTFQNTTLFTLFDGIEVAGDGAASASTSVARVEISDISIEESFDFAALDDVDFL